MAYFRNQKAKIINNIKIRMHNMFLCRLEIYLHIQQDIL